MRSEGDCEAIANAVEEPIDSGLTPVISTGDVSDGIEVVIYCRPVLSQICSENALATSRPPVSWFHSGCEVDAMTVDIPVSYEPK